MRVLAVLLTFAFLSAAWAEAEDPHALVFDMKRKYFVNPNWGQEENAVQGPFGDYDLAAHGFLIQERDFETGHQYFARTSVVNIVPDENGDLIVREGIRVPGEGGEGVRYLAAEDLHIPLATDPFRAPNPIFGRHPLALVSEELREVINFPPLVRTREGEFQDIEEHVDNHWHYVVYRNHENGQVDQIVLFDRNTGGVFMRAHYDNWHQSPSGRMIPGTAIMRTFKGDQDKPVVEVHVANMEEIPLADLRDRPVEEDPAEVLPGDEEGPLIEYRPGRSED